jgi:anaerobic carbon-monoxide dehydrogenase iron sulfur subunit
MAKKKRILYTNRPWEATGICSGCRLCELYCSLQHIGAFNPKRARIKVVELATGIDVPVTCQQCEDPPCQAACCFEAIVFDETLKIAVVKEEKCTGCQACAGACPYGAIIMDPQTKKALKCDLCGGDVPACVAICPSHVLGALDNVAAAEHVRRRFATVLAQSDELMRYQPKGEDPIYKLQEKKAVHDEH